jgi:hypothetical protein
LVGTISGTSAGSPPIGISRRQPAWHSASHLGITVSRTENNSSSTSSLTAESGRKWLISLRSSYQAQINVALA